MLSLAFSESVSLFRLECGDTVGFASLILPQVCNVCNGIFMRPQVTIVVSMHSGYRLVSAVGILPCSYEKLMCMGQQCLLCL
jgi:hypothetical protein